MISITNLIQKIKTSREEEKYRAEGQTITDWFQDLELEEQLAQDPVLSQWQTSSAQEESNKQPVEHPPNEYESKTAEQSDQGATPDVTEQPVNSVDNRDEPARHDSTARTAQWQRETKAPQEDSTKETEHPLPQRTESKSVQLTRKELDLFHKKCITHFIRSTKLNPADWKKYRDKIFIVSDLVPAGELPDHIAPYIPLTEKQQTGLKIITAKYQGTSTQLFSLINEKLPQKKQVLKIGKLARPVAADIYIIGHQLKPEEKS